MNEIIMHMNFYSMGSTGSYVQVQSRSGLSVHHIMFQKQNLSLGSLLRTISTG